MVKPFSTISKSLVGSPSILTALTVTASVIASPVIGSPTHVQYVPNEFKSQLDLDIDEVFLNTEEFGEFGTYRHISGKTYQIKLIWNDAYMEVDPDTQVGVMSSEPFCYIDTLAMKEEHGPGDILTVRNIPYKVDRVEPDGTGISAVFLQRNR